MTTKKLIARQDNRPRMNYVVEQQERLEILKHINASGGTIDDYITACMQKEAKRALDLLYSSWSARAGMPIPSRIETPSKPTESKRQSNRVSKPRTRSRRVTAKGEIGVAVRAALRRTGAEFTAQDLLQNISGPELDLNQVRNKLYHLVSRGIVDKIGDGRFRKSSMLDRIDSNEQV